MKEKCTAQDCLRVLLAGVLFYGGIFLLLWALDGGYYAPCGDFCPFGVRTHGAAEK